MAINVTFNGATIFKPGAYSKTNIDLSGGFDVGPAGLVAVIGEADAGTPGANEVNIANNRFDASQVVSIRNKYREGPIVDAASFLFAPAADAGIPSGAQTVWFYKTNASTRASLAMATTYGTARATEYGVGGNRVTLTVTNVAETAPTVTGAAFDATAISGGETFTYTSGGDSATTNVFTATAAAVTVALMQTDLDNTANWSLGVVPADATFTAGGTDAACTITITMNADATAHTNGYGRSFEISGSAGLGTTDGQTNAAVEPSSTLKLDNKRDNIQEEEAAGGSIVMSLGRDSTGAVTSAAVTVNADNILLIENAATVLTMPKESYTTLSQVLEEINLQSGWTASIGDTLFNQLSPDSLDEVTAVPAFTQSSTEPARLKKDADDVSEFFALAATADITDQADTGLPDALTETFLAGGTRGATTSASIVDALTAFEKFHVNSIVPLFSQDATFDIAEGTTDAASTYTLAGTHQAVKTHISTMKSTKRRSERQGYLSMKDTYANCKTQSGVLADARLQLMIQDIRQIDSQGAIRFFLPWAGSCMLAGARGGAPIGEPMTFKFMNASGIRHTEQQLSTAEEDIVIDFDPDLQSDDAIQAGITFLEAPQTGGFRVVVDNTTYGIDNNFVFNRANVLYAADQVAFNFRTQMENIFVGKKNTVSVTDIASTASSILATFQAQGITVSTADAPQGFKSLSVELDGNIIRVSVTIKIVEGIDFVLSEITIERASGAT